MAVFAQHGQNPRNHLRQIARAHAAADEHDFGALRVKPDGLLRGALVRAGAAGEGHRNAGEFISTFGQRQPPGGGHRRLAGEHHVTLDVLNEGMNRVVGHDHGEQAVPQVVAAEVGDALPAEHVGADNQIRRVIGQQLLHLARVGGVEEVDGGLDARRADGLGEAVQPPEGIRRRLHKFDVDVRHGGGQLLPAECHAILKSAFHAALRQRFHHRVRRRVVSAAGGCGEYECLQLVLLPGGIFRQHFVNDFAGHADDFCAGAAAVIRVCPRIRGGGFRLLLAP